MTDVKKILPNWLYSTLVMCYLHAIETDEWFNYRKYSFIASIFFLVRPSTITKSILDDEYVIDTLFPKTPSRNNPYNQEQEDVDVVDD